MKLAETWQLWWVCLTVLGAAFNKWAGLVIFLVPFVVVFFYGAWCWWRYDRG